MIYEYCEAWRVPAYIVTGRDMKDKINRDLDGVVDSRLNLPLAFC